MLGGGAQEGEGRGRAGGRERRRHNLRAVSAQWERQRAIKRKGRLRMVRSWQMVAVCPLPALHAAGDSGERGHAQPRWEALAAPHPHPLGGSSAAVLLLSWERSRRRIAHSANVHRHLLGEFSRSGSHADRDKTLP